MTQEQLEARLEEFRKDAEWMLDEWYEKFSTLHARLAKRSKRDAAPPVVANGHSEARVPRPSILHVPRKPWST